MHSSTKLLYVTVILGTCIGCEGVLGLNDYRVKPQEESSQIAETCSTHLDCAGRDVERVSLCTPQRRCLSPQTDQCKLLSRAAPDARALVLGSLFSVSGGNAGSGAAYDTARQNAVVMAVDEINERGGVPALGSAVPRKLILVSCDTSGGAEEAARQLVKLGAVAVVGPADSDAVLSVSTKQTISAGTLLISPTATSSSIKDLLDADLSWLMSPTVEQRAPLMKLLLAALEQQLVAERTPELKLGVIFDDDTLGQSSLASLQEVKFAGESLSLSGKRSGRVRIDRFPGEATDRAALIAAYRAFAPDVIVLLGQTPLITEWMAPLERSFEMGGDASSATRPYYVVTEAAKSSELLSLAQQVSGLRTRVRGVSVTPTDRARPVFEGFLNRFDARYGEGAGSAPGVGAAYDALYAIVYALSSIEATPVSGARIAGALHWLSGGSELVAVGTSEMSTAFRKLSAHERIATLGTMSELRWDDAGGTRSGALEVFCLAAGDEPPQFVGSGLRWDVAAEQATGSSSGCGVRSLGVPEVVKTGVPAVDSSSGHLDSMPSEIGQPSTPETMTSMPSAGSAAAGSGNPSGSAGRAGAAGRLGGQAAAGSGGAAGGAPVPSLPHRNTLSCGDRRACQLDRGEYCCISELRPVTGPLPTDLTCRSAPTGGAGSAAAGGSCGLSLYCSSDRECEDGQVCCADETSARCTTALECMRMSHRRIECAAPKDCPAGTQCCIRTEQNLSAFSSTLCETRCPVAAGTGTICQTDADCPMEGNNKFVCNQSYVLPTVRVCWPSQ